MKTLLIILSLNLFANELQWVDEQINAIQPPREGIRKSKVNSIKSPFIFLKKETSSKAKVKKVTKTKRANIISKSEKRLRLEAVINKSALINGKWYKLLDRVGKYKLIDITKENVILSFKRKKLLLSLKKRNSKIKFNNN